MPPRKKAAAPAVRPELVALLEACKDAPEDDDARLVLADWLEEHGDETDRARASFIRLQLRQAREEYGYPTEPLGRAAEALRERHQQAWLGPLWQWSDRGDSSPADAWSFDRGLITLTIRASRLLTRQAARLAGGERWAWVAGVRLTDGRFEGEKGERLIGCLPLEGVRSLRLSWMRLGADTLDGLLASPRLARLTSFELWDTQPKAESAAVVARHLGRLRLRRLGLGHNAIGTAGVGLLARSRHARHLRELCLGHNAIAAAGAAVLGESRQLAELRELDVSNNEIGPAGAAALLGSRRLANLERLNLGGTCFDDAAGLSWAAGLVGGPRLKHLDWRSARVGPVGAAMLARWPRLEKLERLILIECAVGDGGAQALAASAQLGRLKDLSLSSNDIGPDGAAALVGSAALGGLRRLDLSSNPLGDDGAQRIAASPGLARLRELNLWQCGIADAGALALADSPYLPANITLVLYDNKVRAATKPALRAKLGDRLWSV